MIKFSHVMKKFHNITPLKDISAEIQNGEIVYSAPHPQEIIDLELVTESGDTSIVEQGDILRAVKNRTED